MSVQFSERFKAGALKARQQGYAEQARSPPRCSGAGNKCGCASAGCKARAKRRNH